MYLYFSYTMFTHVLQSKFFFSNEDNLVLSTELIM